MNIFTRRLPASLLLAASLAVSAAAAAAQIPANAGTVTHGPIPVPGGAHAVMAKDPRGAAFGLVGGA